MTIDTAPLTAERLTEYETVPIAFAITSVLVAHQVPGAPLFTLEERVVQAPSIKDYDAISERPTMWPHRFDTARWRMAIARIDGRCVGGATVAMATSGVDLLEGRGDLALLWDIRVVPQRRGQGIGRRLFAAAEAIATDARCTALKVETQNINVAACRFYAAMGCELRTVVENAYDNCPGEAQYLWHKALVADNAR